MFLVVFCIGSSTSKRLVDPLTRVQLNNTIFVDAEDLQTTLQEAGPGSHIIVTGNLSEVNITLFPKQTIQGPGSVIDLVHEENGKTYNFASHGFRTSAILVFKYKFICTTK